MASNTGSSSRLGHGGVSGLASSLRAAASSNTTAASSGSPRGQYQRNMDATVPDSDDSTEEDEEYTSYIQEQEQQLRRGDAHSNSKPTNGSAMNVRQLLQEEEEQSQGAHNNHYHNQQQDHDMDMDTNNQLLQARQNEILEDDEDLDDEEDEDEDMEEEGSETLSLTEEDIDFNLVYAFHTFVATQEGQASVVRNDSLMLLEDANVYWWLVRVLKTGVIGYIPAENIETPFERLARLNKYRNVGLSAPAPEWGTFDEPIRPLSPHALAGRSTNRRSVIFNAENEYFGASENEWDSDEGDEDDDMGEYYDGREDEEAEDSDRHGEDDRDQDGGRSGKSALQLEAERVEQEIMDELRQQEQQQRQHHKSRNQYGMEESDQDEFEEEEEQTITNRHRRPLLDDDDLLFSDEPRKISLTPSIAQDDDLLFSDEPRKISLTPSIARDDVTSTKIQTPPGKAKRLRVTDEEPSNVGSLRSGSMAGQRGNDVATSSSSQQSSGNHRSSSFDSEEDDRQQMQKRIQERKEAKLAALLGETDQPASGGASQAAKEDPEPVETVKKPGKFKSLFGVGKSSKDKEKERKEKERLEKERLKNSSSKRPPSGINTAAANNAKSISVAGATNENDNVITRSRTNSNGSVTSVGAIANSNSPLSPTSHIDNGDPQQEIITLRVYPGNVDFGASMYKTVVVSPSTMASEVANHAVVKFKLAPDSVSTTDFFLTVRGVDGDETVLQPTDRIMAIYQSLTAHLTTPLPPNHRLSISSVSSMMSVNSTSSYTSISSPLSPNSVRRIGSGRSDPHQRSIRFLLNKRIRRSGSISSIPGTPTTPTTPITPTSSMHQQQDDFFWVKVICLAQELPQTMILIDGIRVALDKNDVRAQGQITSAKVEHWIPMLSTSNAGDVIFKTLDMMEIRSGVVNGVPEHVLAAKRNSVPNGIVIEYQLGLRLNGQTSHRAKQGDELPLPPQIPLTRCFEDHHLVPVRRSPKADVASMPLSPDHVFYLRKAPKSIQAEKDFETQKQQSSKKAPTPLQVQALRPSPANEPQRSPLSPTGVSSPRSLRSLRSNEDMNATVELDTGGPQRAAQNPNSIGRNAGVPGSPSQIGNDIRIPRRTDSTPMGPTSPTRSSPHDMSSGRPSPTMTQQQHGVTQGSRTPTPDHNGGRARASSISQISGPGIRLGQAPSPAPSAMSSHTAENDGSRSSTPERPARPERPDRPQRAISPSMTHGPSPLSLAAVMLQQDGSQSNIKNETASRERRGSSTAPLSIKKNATQGMDIVLDKGVIRSSRLINSKQYRYSFIPVEGGEEVDISEIIEDILGEENDVDDGDGGADDGDIQRHVVAASASSGRDGLVVARPARSLSNSSSNRNNGNLSERDRLELLTNSARGGDTLMKLERVLAGDRDMSGNKNSASAIRNRLDTSSPSQRKHDNAPASNNQSKANGPPTSLRNPRRDSDVEIQVASVASLSTRSVSPLMTEHAASARGLSNNSSDVATPSGSPRSLRPVSPYGVMAKPTPISNASNAGAVTGTANKSSPLKDTGIVSDASIDPNQSQDSSQRSFSPIPRRLQSPSPVSKQAANSSRSSSPTSRLAQLNGSNSLNGSTTSLNSTTSNGGKEWLLSSDYNAGMQDLLTLVRAGRSASVSSSSNSPMLLRGPLIGKDGKIVMLPSTIKASLLNNSNGNSRSRSPSLSQLQDHLDTHQDKQGQQQDKYLNNDDKSNSNDKSRNNYERTRMMLMMLNELTLKDVQQECHPEVYECWKDVDADLDRVERELDELLVTVKASMI
ncbi:hypothetical protein BGX26_004794 [Mortierella sp. AD094]|nr:hypothetical protein BGX26_004794 [Mortierella sp. AD094]